MHGISGSLDAGRQPGSDGWIAFPTQLLRRNVVFGRHRNRAGIWDRAGRMGKFNANDYGLWMWWVQLFQLEPGH